MATDMQRARNARKPATGGVGFFPIGNGKAYAVYGVQTNLYGTYRVPPRLSEEPDRVLTAADARLALGDRLQQLLDQ